MMFVILNKIRGDNMSIITERIFSELEKQHISQTELGEYLQLNRNAISDWKFGRNESYYKYISQIADYLNVSTDYLLGKTDISQSINAINTHYQEIISDLDYLNDYGLKKAAERIKELTMIDIYTKNQSTPANIAAFGGDNLKPIPKDIPNAIKIIKENIDK